MATTGYGALTLLDHTKRMGADGKIEGIIEQMTMTNEVLEDMLWLEGNLPTGHRTTVRTGLPESYWRKLNQGIPKSKSTVATITDTVGQLTSESQVDVDIANLQNNRNEFLLSEAMAHMQGMTQTFVETLFYGDTDLYPERFLGLAPRFNLLSAPNGGNIIDAKGTGSDNSSIYLVVWGANTCHGIIPKGLPGGLNHEHKGAVRVPDESNNWYDAYVDTFKWNCGLTVRDWRYVVRIANIDMSDLLDEETAAADLVKLMIKAINKLPTTGGASFRQTTDASSVSGAMGRPVFYCNSDIRTMLEIQAYQKSNLQLTYTEMFGQKILGCRGVPIRTANALVNNEAPVV